MRCEYMMEPDYPCCSILLLIERCSFGIVILTRWINLSN